VTLREKWGRGVIGKREGPGTFQVGSLPSRERAQIEVIQVRGRGEGGGRLVNVRRTSRVLRRS